MESYSEHSQQESDSNIHSEGQDLPLTKLTNTIKAKKVESEKVKAANEPEEQHESPVKSGIGKGYMHSGDQESNVPSAFKKNDVLRKIRSLTVADNFVEERTAMKLIKSLNVEDTYAEWGQKRKGHIVEDPDAQLLLDLCKGSKASRLDSLNQINFKRAVTQKFKEYDQKLEALTPINVSEEIDKAVHAKVLTKMKKLIPTHVAKCLANYVKPHLNNSMLEFMQNNQIRWFTKKSGSANSMRRTTWFDLLLKSNIDKNKDHILGPSTMAIAKKLKEIIQKDELAIAYLEAVLSEAQWNSDEGDVSKPRSFEHHMSKSSKTYPKFTTITFITWHTLALKRSTLHLSPSTMLQVVVKRKWGYEFLSSIMVRRSDKQEYTFSYVDLPRLNINDIEDMYLLKVHDKMHHLLSDDEKDFNKALLLFIQSTIPYTMTGIEKGVVYLNKYNRRSLMKLNKVHKFCDGTLMKIQENLIEMIIKNKLGRGNERLRGRDWNDKDVKRSQEMVDKIN
ncbi:hypothetical protein Tco_1276377 [Tanacetum coccineum]